MIKYRFIVSKYPSELKKNFLRKEVQEMLENEIEIKNEFEDVPPDMNQIYRVVPSMYTEDVVAVFESPVDGKWHFYLEEEFLFLKRRYDVLIGVYREHREDFLDGIKTPELREMVLKDEASDDNYSIFRLPWFKWDEYTSLDTKEILESLENLPRGEDFGEDTWFVYAMMERATSADEVEVYGDPENFPVFISLSIGSELHEEKYNES